MAEYCLSNDGTDDVTNCGHDSSLNITGDISIEVHFKGTSGDYNANDGLITKWDAGADKRSFSLKFATGEKWDVQLSDDGTFGAGHYKEYTGSDVFDGDWHYLAFTFDASESELLMYEDGSVITPTKINDDAITELDSNNADLLIGAELNNGSARRFIKACVDEVRISNTVRTAAEITSNDHSGSPFPFEVDEYTAALWRMNEGTGDTIYDATTNDNDGDITGASWATGRTFTARERVALTLRPRSLGLTLPSRSLAMTLRPRSTSLTLPER